MKVTAAITLETLSAFCSPDKRGMTRPWRRGKFSFATDGHVLVRVPALAGCYTGIKAPSDGIVSYVLSFFPKAATWERIPKAAKGADSFTFGEARFPVAYLVKIAALPGVAVTSAPVEFMRREGKLTVKALAFRFDGDGIGLLLPLTSNPEKEARP